MRFGCGDLSVGQNGPIVEWEVGLVVREPYGLNETAAKNKERSTNNKDAMVKARLSQMDCRWRHWQLPPFAILFGRSIGAFHRR